MAAYKKDNKYYIHGKIKKSDGTYYSYTKKAPVNSLKKAREYELEFIRKYQDIEVSKGSITFRELCDEYSKYDTNIKESSQVTKQALLDKACIELGKIKINLITVNKLRSFTGNLINLMFL